MKTVTRLFILAHFCFAASATAKDVFVTIGGGAESTSNQISLENNVKFAARVLEQHYPQPLDHRILFADGKSPDPDLQFIDDSSEITAATQWMSEILGDPTWNSLRYRNHHDWDHHEPADKAHVRDLFHRLTEELVAGDRLFVYVTAHGSSAEIDIDSDTEDVNWVHELNVQGNIRNTTISLWNDEQLSAQEFTDWLDGFVPEVQVTLVMVQCYSGGFADVVFREANRQLGISDRMRCGFFSQRFDRPAAGCTPEVNEADYQEYSSYFWAALHGRSRDNSEMLDTDYDHDGHISLAEAHAYAIITSNTIDIPVCTSDILLRKYSRIGQTESTDPGSSGVTHWLGSLLGKDDTPQTEIFTHRATISQSLEIGNPVQRFVISELMSQLELAPEMSLQQVQQQAKRIRKQIDKQNEKYDELASTQATLTEEIRETLHRKAPEFRLDGYSPIITEWTTHRSDEFVELVESLEEAQALKHLNEQISQLDESVNEKMLHEAKLRRLATVIQNVLLEKNLPLIADAPTVERIQQTIAQEYATLW